MNTATTARTMKKGKANCSKYKRKKGKPAARSLERCGSANAATREDEAVEWQAHQKQKRLETNELVVEA